jgi:hypothetical protein
MVLAPVISWHHDDCEIYFDHAALRLWLEWLHLLDLRSVGVASVKGNVLANVMSICMMA